MSGFHIQVIHRSSGNQLKSAPLPCFRFSVACYNIIVTIVLINDGSFEWQHAHSFNLHIEW